MRHDISGIGGVEFHGGETTLVGDGIMSCRLCARRFIGAEAREHDGGRVGGRC